MGFSYNVNVLNQKGSPAIYTDTFSNRPAFGFAGRLFIANDTAAIYEDTGTAWVLIANVSSGAGTLQQVTTNGNTSNVGISVTAGGVSTNSATITSLTTGSVPFVGAAGLITQDNTNLFFDDTNNRLGINTNTPSNNLDVHGAGTSPIIAINNTAGNQSLIGFAKNSTAKWRIGNSSTDTFDVLNVGLSTNAITISSASNSVSFLASIKIQQAAGFAGIAGFNGIGCDAGGFFFQIGTNTNNPYFNFIGLTGARTYTYPDATGTLALTSDLGAYLPLSGGTLSGALNGTSASLTANIANTLDVLGSIRTDGTGNGINLRNTFTATISNPTPGTRDIRLDQDSTGTVFFKANGNVLLNSSTDDTVNKLQVTGSAAIGTPSSSIQKVDIIGGTANNPTVNLRGGASSSTFGDSARLTITDGTNSRNWSLQSNAAQNLSLWHFNSGWVNVGNFNNATGIYTPTSDFNKKKDFENSEIGLNAILKLKPTLYRMISENKNSDKHLGFIAQEVKEFIPQAFVQNDDFIGLDFQAITTTLVKAIQEQQSIIENLLQRIELLENK